jgi:DNA-binding PucR family transcriptional regulator
VLSRVVAEAQREREEVLGGAMARRTETVRLILEDAPIDAQTASRRLGYELDRQHTAAVLWAEAPGVPQGALESAAELLARAVGTRRPLTLAAGTSTLWVWLGGVDDFGAADIAALLGEVHGNIRVAVGPTERGIRGFRRSHEAALTVHRLLAGPAEGERFATYAELEVTALAARDERRAADFVAATLGPLAADDAGAWRLRETLRVFLEEAENAPRAAARLHTHRNTILQRIARATELLGHRPGERRLAVELALELARRLGPRVLVRVEPGPKRELATATLGSGTARVSSRTTVGTSG